MSQDFKIASPCTASWDRMEGDDKVRYCSECTLHVYNFAAMSPAEIEELTATHTGRLCGRLYRRSDGTILTRDCSVGARIIVKRRTYLAGAALAAVLSLGSAAAAQVSKPGVHTAQKQQEQNDSEIYLVVQDQAGAVIPKARVLLLDPARNLRLKTVTDSNGRAKFPRLKSASYQIVVTATGFEMKPKTLIVANHEKLAATIELDVSLAEMGLVVEAHVVDPLPPSLPVPFYPLGTDTPRAKKTPQRPKD